MTGFVDFGVRWNAWSLSVFRGPPSRSV